MSRKPTPLEKAAFSVAAWPPTRRGAYSHDAYVPWELIEDLRTALRDAGWNIDEQLRTRDQRKKDERRERAKKLTEGAA